MKKHADVSVSVVVSAHELQMTDEPGSSVAEQLTLQAGVVVEGLCKQLPTTWCQEQRHGAGYLHHQPQPIHAQNFLQTANSSPHLAALQH